MRGYELHPLLAASARFLGLGHVRGELLDLGRYPGLVEGRHVVQGEIYQLDDPEVLRAIDRAEGYNFQRRLKLVTLADRRRRQAWLYEYSGPRQGAIPIPDGNYHRTGRGPRRAGRGLAPNTIRLR